MKAYSICLMALMIVNFGIMIYKKTEKGIVIIIGIVAYGMFVFTKDLFSDEYPFFGYLLALVCLSLFLYKKYGSQCLGTIFFALPYVIFTRALGLPDNPNFGEKELGIYFISGICGTFSLWLLLLKYHQKLYQKILFWVLNISFLFLFYAAIQTGENINYILKYIISGIGSAMIIIALIFLPIAYLFFYCGELIILLTLCHKFLPEDSKSPTPKES
ncbi:hypothetical protein [Helicobacter cholecystus]|uniref:hypothetical protein n=1 Tax=Helicobacter cholecystus TaxID=45498 RepID=UPI002739F929|nr:hypothetical protein [Helicobacter cholecystus]